MPLHLQFIPGPNGLSVRFLIAYTLVIQTFSEPRLIQESVDCPRTLDERMDDFTRIFPLEKRSLLPLVRVKDCDSPSTLLCTLSCMVMCSLHSRSCAFLLPLASTSVPSTSQEHGRQYLSRKCMTLLILILEICRALHNRLLLPAYLPAGLYTSTATLVNRSFCMMTLETSISWWEISRDRHCPAQIF